MRTRRAVVLVTLLCSTSAMAGCTTWSRPTANLPEAVARNGASLRLTLVDGRIVQLNHHPTVRGDSIAEQAGSVGREPRVVAMSDVTAVQTRHFSAGKTLLLALGIAGGVVIVGLAALAIACPAEARCFD